MVWSRDFCGSERHWSKMLCQMAGSILAPLRRPLASSEPSTDFETSFRCWTSCVQHWNATLNPISRKFLFRCITKLARKQPRRGWSLLILDHACKPPTILLWLILGILMWKWYQARRESLALVKNKRVEPDSAEFLSSSSRSCSQAIAGLIYPWDKACGSCTRPRSTCNDTCRQAKNGLVTL